MSENFGIHSTFTKVEQNIHLWKGGAKRATVSVATVSLSILSTFHNFM
jgi:hypothetical protein